MDYKERYEKALKRAETAINIAADKDLVKGVATTIFPELKESEDEKNWKIVMEYVKDDALRDWLEKQKESLHISETCKENSDSFTDEDERIRKKMIEHFKSKTKDTWCNMPVKDIISYLEKQKEQNLIMANSPQLKEQKPASTEDMPYITDEHFYEREPVDSFRYKLAKYMTQNSRKEESPDGYTYHISAETILEMAKEELLKRGVVQKPVVTHGETYHVDTLGTQQVIAGKMPQKPAEWSEEDEKMINTLVSYVEDPSCWNLKCPKEKLVSFIESLPKRFSLQPKQEWSDEDSDNLERVDNYLWMLDDYVGDDCAMPQGKTDKIRGNIHGVLSPWLKSLPERFNPQPKAEWSKEDEQNLNVCLSYIKDEPLRNWLKDAIIRCGKSAEWSKEDRKMIDHLIEALPMWANGRIAMLPSQAEEYVERLKSLRPSWKPSEEQMDAFRSYIKDFQEKAEAAVGGWNNFDVMIRLFEQLNKLKGGVAPMREIDE